MNGTRYIGPAAGVVLGLSAIGVIGAGMVQQGQERRQEAPGQRGGAGKADQAQINSLIASWPQESKKAAKEMMDKYGPPHEATQSLLIWHDTGPFTKTVVHAEPVEHNFPMPHKDVLEQFIDYKMPPEKFSDIAKYDGSVICERTKGCVSARCDKEAMNFLALNLAHDIATGKRNVEDARQFYAKTAMAFMEGSQDPYTQELQFPAQRDTKDPDQPAKR